jgi:hypothetical protein
MSTPTITSSRHKDVSAGKFITINLDPWGNKILKESTTDIFLIKINNIKYV